MSSEASIGFALATVTIVLGSTLVNEPKGGARKFYRMLFGKLAFAGDGSEPPSPAQKGMRALSSAVLAAAAAYFLYEGLR